MNPMVCGKRFMKCIDVVCRLSRLFAEASALWAFSTVAYGDVRLPAFFSDHMVLQAGTGVPIWGWADPGENVTVEVAGQVRKDVANLSGKWRVKFDRLKPGTPLTLTVRGRNTKVVKDVLVGEVWLASGQSNMALLVSAAGSAEEEIAAADYPAIRFFTANSAFAAPVPQEDCAGTWEVCSRENVGRFSAAAYYFARELHRALGVPVGIIHSSVGGTPIESWISAEAQERLPELRAHFEEQARAAREFDIEAARAKFSRDLEKWKAAVEETRAEGKEPPRAPGNPVTQQARVGGPGGLFNRKIAPLVPYAIRGTISYQGEANSSPTKAPLYQFQLPALIRNWRERWGYEFPFAWVQLPNFEGGPARDWPLIREAMLKTLRLRLTGMAVTIDIGEADNIHPKNKQEVGRRLALWALGDVYKRKVPSTSGPLLEKFRIHEREVVLKFRHSDSGLVAKGGELRGFLVAGDDFQWKPAQARIEHNSVVVWNREVKHPAAVRYGWANNPDCNLYNGAGLPASPFRTDHGK